MARRLDEIFDPAKLRDAWGRVPTAAERAAAKGDDAAGKSKTEAAAPADEALAVWSELEAEVRRTIGEGPAGKLGPVLERGRELLGRRFPPEGPAPGPGAVEELRKELGQLLDDLEDMLEAFEMMARAKS